MPDPGSSIFFPCPQCGCLIVSQPGKPAVSPCLGLSHDCTVALIQAAAGWQFVVRLASNVARRQ